MNRNVMRIIIGLVFIVLGIIKIITLKDYYWALAILGGLIFIYKGINGFDKD